MLNTNAEVLHLNPRKQGTGPDPDDKALALDVKLKAEGVSVDLVSRLVGCADARAYLWDADGNPVLLGVTEMASMAEYEDIRGDIAGYTVLAAKLKKFRITPRAKWGGDLVFQLSLSEPDPGLLPTLAEYLGESVQLRLERSQEDLFEQQDLFEQPVAQVVYYQDTINWPTDLEPEPLAWDAYVELYPGETTLPLPAPLWCWWWLAWTDPALVEPWLVQARWIYGRLIEITAERDGMPEPWSAASQWVEVKPLAILDAVEPVEVSDPDPAPATPSPATGSGGEVAPALDSKATAYRDGFGRYGRGGPSDMPQYGDTATGAWLAERWRQGWERARALAARCRAVAEAEAPAGVDVLTVVHEFVAYEDEVIAAGWGRLHGGEPTHLGKSVRWCLERGRDLLMEHPRAPGNPDLLASIARMLGEDCGVLVMTGDESAALLAEMREQTARLQAATMPRAIDTDAEFLLDYGGRLDKSPLWPDATPELIIRALEIEAGRKPPRKTVVKKLQGRLGQIKMNQRGIPS